MLVEAFTTLRRWIDSARSEDGAGIVEYLLLIVAIALLVIGAMTLFSEQLSGVFQDIGNTLSTAPS